MNKIAIKIVWLGFLLSTLVLTACGTDTPTAAPAITTAPSTTAVASTADVTTAPVATTAALATTPAATAPVATTSALATTPAAAATRPLRNVRYCEVIPVFQESGKLVQYVYNTMGLNDCPADAWNMLNANDLAKNLGAIKVVLNGPRYWVLDQIIASGDSVNGEVKTFGDLKMQYRAKIEVPLSSATAGSGISYTAIAVQRNTEYVFSGGKPIYQLVSPEGDVYIMQTYAQIVDPKLTINDLPTLGTRLKLPTGWQYRSTTPDQDLHLVVNGTAYVLQDDLQNSYQKVIK